MSVRMQSCWPGSRRVSTEIDKLGDLTIPPAIPTRPTAWQRVVRFFRRFL